MQKEAFFATYVWAVLLLQLSWTLATLGYGKADGFIRRRSTIKCRGCVAALRHVVVRAMLRSPVEMSACPPLAPGFDGDRPGRADPLTIPLLGAGESEHEKALQVEMNVEKKTKPHLPFSHAGVLEHNLPFEIVPLRKMCAVVVIESVAGLT